MFDPADNAQNDAATTLATTTSIITSLATTLVSSTIASSSSSIPSATSIPGHGPEDGPNEGNRVGEGECNLLGPFSLFVQGALGLLALLSLVWKRWRERPQRPLKIWGFDVSKQVVGSALVHVANLLMSMLSAGQFTVSPSVAGEGVDGAAEQDGAQYRPNPCSFYLLNLAIDTTIGIPILVGLLKIVTYGVSLTPLGNPPESIKSGNYGDPPKARWWFKQSIIYFLGLLGMKVCVLFIFTLLPWISKVGDWALQWTEGNKTLQVFFVMLLFPLIMNALQYYIIDSFIKEQPTNDHTRVVSAEDEHDTDEDRPSHSVPRHSSDDEFPGDENNPPTKGTKSAEFSQGNESEGLIRSAQLEEYDPKEDEANVYTEPRRDEIER